MYYFLFLCFFFARKISGKKAVCTQQPVLLQGYHKPTAQDETTGRPFLEVDLTFQKIFSDRSPMTHGPHLHYQRRFYSLALGLLKLQINISKYQHFCFVFHVSNSVSKFRLPQQQQIRWKCLGTLSRNIEIQGIRATPPLLRYRCYYTRDPPCPISEYPHRRVVDTVDLILMQCFHK